MVFLQIDPALVAGKDPLLWAMVIAVMALTTSTVWLAKNLYHKAGRSSESYQKLLRETLDTLHEIGGHMDKVSTEFPRMNTDVRQCISDSAGSVKDHVTVQIERLQTIARHGRSDP